MHACWLYLKYYVLLVTNKTFLYLLKLSKARNKFEKKCPGQSFYEIYWKIAKLCKDIPLGPFCQSHDKFGSKLLHTITSVLCETKRKNKCIKKLNMSLTLALASYSVFKIEDFSLKFVLGYTTKEKIPQI